MSMLYKTVNAMKIYEKLILCAMAMALMLSLTGCRTRILTTPDNADEILSPPAGVNAVTTDTERLPTLEQKDSPKVEDTPNQPDGNGESKGGGFGETEGDGISATYDPNGGDSDIAIVVVHTGEKYGNQPTVVRRGYSFDGWWTKSSGGEKVTPDTVVSATQDHTLYAHWKSTDACIVHFDSNGGRLRSSLSELRISAGDAFGQMPVPIREGYDLDGWFTASNGGRQVLETDIFDGQSDLTLYAHWTYNPLKFWSFTLKNKSQQIYLCQQASLYYETETDNITQISCPLISATGSQNVAANRDDPNVTDEWVNEKRPAAIIKCVGSASEISAATDAMSTRFPGKKIVIVTRQAVSGDEASAVYAGLALAKELYSDWYKDVDLAVVANELGVDPGVIYIK